MPPPPSQLIDHIPVVFSIIDCASFFVSSCFSSLEPKTKCELLLSLGVTRQQIASKDISSLTTGWIFTKLCRNDSYMTLFDNCSNSF